MTYVVDTHALVWFLEGSPKLGRQAHAALANDRSRLVIPTIVLAEITFLYARRRIRFDRAAILARISQATNAVVYPLDEAVVERLPTTLDIHDAIIVSTGLVFRDLLHEPTTIITKDRTITQSGLLDIVW